MRLILTVLCCWATLSSMAGHLIGGEIYYECLGNGQYVIALKMYRDCYASGPNVVTQFDSEVHISIYRASNNAFIDTLNIPKPNDSTFIPLVLDVPCMDDPPDLCVVGMEYRDTVFLDVPPGGLHIVNQRCCRTPDALNIVNPSDFGSTYHAFIPDSTVAPCNSSPRFNQVPPIALCTQIYLDLDYSATDPDGDSLVYSMCTPFHGAGNGSGSGTPAPQVPSPPPFQTVNWSTGFSAQHQIPSAPAFEVDSTTGIITGRPNQIGTYAFAVCVKEYRNGILIGENRRDFQMTTTFCEIEAAAAIDSAIEECIGLEIQFFNISTLGKHFHWDFGDTTTTDDTSSVDNPRYTFPDTGRYQIMLVAYGDICSDTTILDYHVRPRLEAHFEPPPSQCLDVNAFNLDAEGHYYPTTEITWTLKVPGVTDSLRTGDSSDYFSSSMAGAYPVHLQYTDYGCIKRHTDSVLIVPNPDFDIATDNPRDCIPMWSRVSGIPEQAYKPTFHWSFEGDTTVGDTLNIFLDSAGARDLWVQLTTDSACIDTVIKHYPRHIMALDTPQAIFTTLPERAGMYEPYFEVFDESLHSRKIEFSIDDSLTYHHPSFSLDLPDTGNHEIRLVATHASGCTDTAYRIVRTEPVYQFFAPNTFTPDENNLNEGWQAFVFVWKGFELTVFDRWGQRVFHTNDPNHRWNGRKYNAGEPCPIGSYSYKARVTDNHDREWLYTGVIHLLR